MTKVTLARAVTILRIAYSPSPPSILLVVVGANRKLAASYAYETNFSDCAANPPQLGLSSSRRPEPGRHLFLKDLGGIGPAVELPVGGDQVGVAVAQPGH